VVQRGIIFIDIAMAQMASLGICLAVLLGLEPEDWKTFVLALAVTLVGAALFSLTGKRSSAVPQEAIIGIAYVVAAAASILLLSRSAHGNEEIRNMLVGDITVVRSDEVWRCLAVFGGRRGTLHPAQSFLLVFSTRSRL
jgi:zinc/manganese transport system permease protein